MMDHYTPHPAHQFIPFGMLLIAAVIATAFPSWITALVFIAVFISAVVTCVWIAIAGKVREETDYWERIGWDIQELRRSDPEIWQALGFMNPPERVKVDVNVTGEPEESPYYALNSFTLNISPAKMETFANAIITGAKTLSEGDWAGDGKLFGSKEFRKFKHELLRGGFTIQNNLKDSRQGFSLTKKGEMLMYHYASEGVKSDVRLRVMGTGVTTPLSE